MVDFYRPYKDIVYSDFHPYKYLDTSEGLLRQGWGCLGADWSVLETSEPYIPGLDYYPYVLELIFALNERCVATNIYYPIRLPTHGEDIHSTLHDTIHDLYMTLTYITDTQDTDAYTHHKKWVDTVSDDYTSEDLRYRIRMFPVDYAPTSSAYIPNKKTIYTHTREYLDKIVSDTYPKYGAIAPAVYSESGDLIRNGTLWHSRRASKYTIHALRYLRNIINNLTKLATKLTWPKFGEYHIRYGWGDDADTPIPLVSSSNTPLKQSYTYIENALSYRTLYNNGMDTKYNIFTGYPQEYAITVNDPIRHTWLLGDTGNGYAYRCPMKYIANRLPGTQAIYAKENSYTDIPPIMVFKGTASALSDAIDQNWWVPKKNIAIYSSYFDISSAARSKTPIYANHYLDNFNMSSTRKDVFDIMQGPFGTAGKKYKQHVLKGPREANIPVFLYDNHVSGVPDYTELMSYIVDTMPHDTFIGLVGDVNVGYGGHTYIPITYIKKSRAYELQVRGTQNPRATSYRYSGDQSTQHYTHTTNSYMSYVEVNGSVIYSDIHDSEYTMGAPCVSYHKPYELIQSYVKYKHMQYYSYNRHTIRQSTPHTEGSEIDIYRQVTKKSECTLDKKYDIYSSTRSEAVTYQAHYILDATYYSHSESGRYYRHDRDYDIVNGNSYLEWDKTTKRNSKSNTIRGRITRDERFERISYILRRSEGFNIARRVSAYGRLHHQVTEDCNTVHYSEALNILDISSGNVASCVGNYYDFMNLSVIEDIYLESVLSYDRHRLHFDLDKIHPTEQGMAYRHSSYSSMLVSYSDTDDRGYTRKYTKYRRHSKYRATHLKLYQCPYIIEDFAVSGGFYFK